MCSYSLGLMGTSASGAYRRNTRSDGTRATLLLSLGYTVIPVDARTWVVHRREVFCQQLSLSGYTGCICIMFIHFLSCSFTFPLFHSIEVLLVIYHFWRTCVTASCMSSTLSWIFFVKVVNFVDMYIHEGSDVLHSYALCQSSACLKLCLEGYPVFATRVSFCA